MKLKNLPAWNSIKDVFTFFLLKKCSQCYLDCYLNAPFAHGECIVSTIRSNARRGRPFGDSLFWCGQQVVKSLLTRSVTAATAHKKGEAQP